MRGWYREAFDRAPQTHERIHPDRTKLDLPLALGNFWRRTQNVLPEPAIGLGAHSRSGLALRHGVPERFRGMSARQEAGSAHNRDGRKSI